MEIRLKQEDLVVTHSLSIELENRDDIFGTDEQGSYVMVYGKKYYTGLGYYFKGDGQPSVIIILTFFGTKYGNYVEVLLEERVEVLKYKSLQYLINNLNKGWE